MTSIRDVDEQKPGARLDSPPGTSVAGPAPLSRLDVLIGDWAMEAIFAAGALGPNTPAITNRDGRTTFAWLDGGFFLVQRFASGHLAGPSGIAIIAADQGPETFSQRYFDSRGVARVYRMVLDSGAWKLWREEPGLWQRYTE